MKILVLICLLLFPLSTNATITRVQSASGGTGAAQATSFTITFGSNLTVGNTVVVVVGKGAGGGFYCSTSGIVGGVTSYLQATSTFLEVHILRVVTATNVLTFTSTSATAADICGAAAEYTATNPKIDGHPVTNGTSVSPATGSFTTTVGSEILIGALVQRTTKAAVDTAWLTSITNSFSSVIQTSTNRNVSNVDRSVALLERTVTSTGSYSTGGTSATNGVWLGATIALYEVQFKRVFGD